MTRTPSIALLLLHLLHLLLASSSASNKKYPIGAWIMSEVFRGANLGSGGSALRMSLGKKREFKHEGPRPFPHLKYAYFDGSVYNLPRIQIAHEGIFLFSFWKPFTITVWLKNDEKRRGTEVLLEGWTSKMFQASSIGFYRTGNLNYITLAGERFLRTTSKAVDKLPWRHVSVTYDGFDNYAFYLNGTTWPIWGTGAKNRTMRSTVYIQVGRLFSGSMACLLIFQRVLTQEEVQKWMRECP